MRIEKIVFMGSSTFAIPPLEALLETGFKPLVITKPDRPKGRGNRPGSTPVKEWAMERGLDVREPETLEGESFFGEISMGKPDLIVSAAYGGRIPLQILNLPPFGAVNLHPSLLPLYRGAAPVQRALMVGDVETGITLATMAEKWDSGDILLQKKCAILPEDDTGTLLERLSREGALLLKEALPLMEKGEILRIPQDESKVTFAPRIREEEGWVRWEKSARSILSQVRAFSPAAGATSFYENTRVKIFKVLLRNQFAGNPPGTVVKVEGEGPVVSCGEESVLLLSIQPENRKIMTGKDFVNGYRVETGRSFHS